MFGGVNPKQMQAAMKQMGISQTEIPTSKVIIEKEDGSRTIMENPSVTKIKMQGQTSYQIAGEEYEETQEVGVSEEDIKTIVEKTGVSEEKAKETLERTGDLAESIMELS